MCAMENVKSELIKKIFLKGPESTGSSYLQ